MKSEVQPSRFATRYRSMHLMLERALSHTSPVRLLLMICVTIAVAHWVTMFSLATWPAVVPGWTHAATESALLVVLLFPALYFCSFRPLIVQISERASAETTMWQSEHKYRRLFNSLGDAAFLIDLETGRIIDANEQAERLLERGRADIVGTSHDQLFPSENAEEYRLQLSRQNANEGANFEAVVQIREGRRVPVHVSAAPLSLFGRDLVITLFREIADLRNAPRPDAHANCVLTM